MKLWYEIKGGVAVKAFLFWIFSAFVVFSDVNVLPRPESLSMKKGRHKVSPTAFIGLDGTVSPDLKISFLASEDNLGKEGYLLDIGPEEINIWSSSEAGRYYALITLRQLLAHKQHDEIPCARIKDRPRYSWRGFMIDSGRQYQQVDTIKGLLDRMAMLKMNVFHWHLTENDGWRIEIKNYPKLTELGAFIAGGPEQRGFYTQDQIKEIVQYATQRHITVVPEIDIPGHSNAALSAYPELTCQGEVPELVEGHSPYLYCAGRESTYRFLFDVFDEVCALFPAEYVHIGGDEAPKDEWKRCRFCQKAIKDLGLKNEHELHIEMVNRLARYLGEKGRMVICWGDVVAIPSQELEGNIVIDWWNWRGRKDFALREAMRRKMKVVANSNYYTYLNFPQHPWRGYKENRTFDFKVCYEKNPSDIQNPTANEQQALLGMSCSLWTDYGLTEDLLDVRLFPRIFALSEQMWSRADRLPFEDFRQRVYEKKDILEHLGINGCWETLNY